MSTGRTEIIYADEILPRIWLGSWDAAHDENFLVNTPISKVLSLTNRAPNHTEKLILEDINWKHISVRDRKTVLICELFDELVNYVESAVDAEEQILIHCHQGVSRSATIVCAYLMKTKGWSTQQSIGFVQSKRKIVKPNIGFEYQLKTWERLNYTVNLDTIEDDIRETVRIEILETRKTEIENQDFYTLEEFNDLLFELVELESLDEAREFTPQLKGTLEACRERSNIGIDFLELQDYYKNLGRHEITFMNTLAELGFLTNGLSNIFK